MSKIFHGRQADAVFLNDTNQVWDGAAFVAAPTSGNYPAGTLFTMAFATGLYQVDVPAGALADWKRAVLFENSPPAFDAIADAVAEAESTGSAGLSVPGVVVSLSANKLELTATFAGKTLEDLEPFLLVGFNDNHRQLRQIEDLGSNDFRLHLVKSFATDPVLDDAIEILG